MITAMRGYARILLLAAMTLAAAPAAFAAEGVGGPPPVVRIRPLMLPVITPDQRVERYTQIEVTLEVTDSLKLGTVQEAQPKLHDAILTQLYHAIDEGYIIRGAVANAPALRRLLLEAATSVVGKDVIGRVLITPATRQSAWP